MIEEISKKLPLLPDDEMPTEQVTPVKDEMPTEQVTPVDDEMPTEQVTPVDDEMPTEQVTPVKDEMPTEQVTLVDDEMPTEQVTPVKNEVTPKKVATEWAELAISSKGAIRRKEGSDPTEDKRDIHRLVLKLLSSTSGGSFEKNRQILKRQMEFAVASGDEGRMIEVTRLVSELPDLKLKEEFSRPLNDAMEAKDLDGIKAALQDIQDAQIAMLPKEEVDSPKEASV